MNKKQEGNKRHKTMKQTSKYKGVSYVLKDKKWKAQIMIEKMKYNIGNFSNELDAVRAYDEIAKELSNKQLHFRKHTQYLYQLICISHLYIYFKNVLLILYFTCMTISMCTFVFGNKATC